jgi:hypothetical protein
MVYLRCGSGQNDWQLRRMLTTSKYIALTLPKPVAKHVRDIIYFRDIAQCTVNYSQKLPGS